MQHRRILVIWFVIVAFLVILWSISTAPSSSSHPQFPPPVPASARSAASAAIASHLEYGGDFFGVMDIQGDLHAWGDRYAALLRDVMKLAPNNARTANLDYPALFQRLGLYGIAGAGVSSWRSPGESFHHNRAFLYVPEGRQGLLQIFGGAPVPFLTPTLASVDTDLACEFTVDLKSLADLAFSYERDLAGPDALAQTLAQLRQPVFPAANVTGQWLLEHGNTRVLLLVRADNASTVHLPQVTLPHLDFLLSLDGFADLFTQIQPFLATMTTISEQGGLHTATLTAPLPVPGYQPELIADPQSGRLYLVSRPEFANVTVFGQGPRLGTSPDYQAATAGLPATGNGLSYVSKKGITAGIEVYSQSLSQIPPAARQSFQQSAFADYQSLTHGIGSTQVNLPDGILVQSIAPQSNKGIVLAGPVFAGLMAAMAFPAFEKVHAQSSTKAVTNNLRQLASAGQQYMLDKGVTSAHYPDLVGTGTDKYIRSVTPVAGENYQDLIINQTTTQISVTTANGDVITYNL